MKIALTGGSGHLGRAIANAALASGHRIISIDRVGPSEADDRDNLSFVLADIADYEALVDAFEGCDALIHMAAIPVPGKLADHVVHNNNVTGSYNALRAAAEHGIKRVCQASSVNAIGLAFSRKQRFDYFPIDEKHANYCEDPYSLSKWICEQQADSFVRRCEDMRIASLRFHFVVHERETAARAFRADNLPGRQQLWAYVRADASAQACLLSLEASFKGHEVFYIVAPDTTVEVPSAELAARYYPEVAIRGDLSGNRSFFSSEKAGRVLGWKHPPAP
ncbi:MAG TPA: NAD(P)-dependent oxidoreductase [Devosia sp.]|nr:NAD(P)-dependent oxidoreductase [Devosia sp.]